jgi:hypothetical protein
MSVVVICHFEIWHTTGTQIKKGIHSECPNLLILLEPVEGFEPPTRSLQISESVLPERGNIDQLVNDHRGDLRITQLTSLSINSSKDQSITLGEGQPGGARFAYISRAGPLH